MKREYEKLKKLHNKYLQKEKSRTTSEMEDSVSELRRLNTKLDVSINDSVSKLSRLNHKLT